MNEKKETTLIPYFEEEDTGLKPDLPIIERDTINAIIYDPVTDKVLCLDWEKFNWKTFVIGGIEGSEDPVTAAKREIAEETGYTSVELVAELGKTRSGYFAAHKNENRIANTTALLFVLENNQQIEVVDKEKLPHVFYWIDKANVSSYINLKAQQYIWDLATEALKCSTSAQLAPQIGLFGVSENPNLCDMLWTKISSYFHVTMQQDMRDLANEAVKCSTSAQIAPQIGLFGVTENPNLCNTSSHHMESSHNM